MSTRIRDVRQGPDGWLYVLSDGNNAQVLRLQRAGLAEPVQVLFHFQFNR